MDWMTAAGHGGIFASVLALMGGVRFHVRLERNGSSVPRMRFKIWIDHDK